MDTFDWRKYTQDKILEDLQKVDLKDPSWSEYFTNFDPVTKHNIAMWYLKELVEKGEYVDEIFAIAKIYAEDEDPRPDDEYVGNEKLEAGEEIHNITSVRGVLSWLLTSIAATFRTDLYPEIISMLEKLARDPVYYVRTQATVPLIFFARNIRAYKHPDETPFNFTEDDRERVVSLSFEMLERHRDLPRVLQSVVNIFDTLRILNESQAQLVIEHLFYNSKGELQPEYLTHQAVPLLIFFAEFRSKIGDGFNGQWFKDVALKLLELPEKEAPHLRSTFMWHTWKAIQSDADVYPQFKKYIPLFLRNEFENEPLGQYDFLVNEVLKASPANGVELFKILLRYVLQWSPNYNIQQHAWLLTTHEIVEEIAKISPGDLLDVLRLVTEVVSRGIYIGYLETIYKSYLLVPNKEEGLKMRLEILKLFEIAKQSRWADKLPVTI